MYLPSALATCPQKRKKQTNNAPCPGGAVCPSVLLKHLYLQMFTVVKPGQATLTVLNPPPLLLGVCCCPVSWRSCSSSASTGLALYLLQQFRDGVGPPNALDLGLVVPDSSAHQSLQPAPLVLALQHCPASSPTHRSWSQLPALMSSLGSCSPATSSPGSALLCCTGEVQGLLSCCHSG